MGMSGRGWGVSVEGVGGVGWFRAGVSVGCSVGVYGSRQGTVWSKKYCCNAHEPV